MPNEPVINICENVNQTRAGHSQPESIALARLMTDADGSNHTVLSAKLFEGAAAVATLWIVSLKLENVALIVGRK